MFQKKLGKNINLIDGPFETSCHPKIRGLVLTLSFKLVCMYTGKPRSCAPTRVSSLWGMNPTIPTLYSRQYLSSSSRFHLSICRYLLRFSNTMTPYLPLSRFVSTGNDFPATSTLYLNHRKLCNYEQNWLF